MITSFFGNGKEDALPPFYLVPNPLPNVAKHLDISPSQGKRKAEVFVESVDDFNSQSASNKGSHLLFDFTVEASIGLVLVDELTGGLCINVKGIRDWILHPLSLFGRRSSYRPRRRGAIW